MHPNPDLLRAFLDKEIPETLTHQVREHLARCPECGKRLREEMNRADRVRARLDRLAPGPADQPRSPQYAYARFANPTRMAKTRKEIFLPMMKRRPFWVALSVILVFAVAFSLTPVRAWASDFLSLFRIQKVQVVTFDPQAADRSRESLDANREAIHQALHDNLNVTEKGKVEKVDSVQEAEQAAGFTPRLPSALDDAQLAVKPALQAELTIDQPKFQTLIDAVGVDFQLDKSLDGKVVQISVPAAVIAAKGCDVEEMDTAADAAAAKASAEATARNCTGLVQMPSPEVNAPDGLNMQKMGEAMFQFLGMPNDQARALSQRIDWATTLVLPIPQSDRVSYQEVKVDGVNGTFLQEDDSDGYALVWVKDGILYGLHGRGDLSDAQKLVDSIQ